MNRFARGFTLFMNWFDGICASVCGLWMMASALFVLPLSWNDKHAGFRGVPCDEKAPVARTEFRVADRAKVRDVRARLPDRGNTRYRHEEERQGERPPNSREYPEYERPDPGNVHENAHDQQTRIPFAFEFSVIHSCHHGRLVGSQCFSE